MLKEKYVYLLCLVLLFMGNIVILSIVYKYNKQILNEEDIFELKKFYWGRKKDYRRYTRKWDFDDNILFFSIYFSITLFIMVLALVLYGKYPSLWTGTGIYINEIPEILLNTFLGTFAIIGIAAVINKNHFITFSITDILEYFKIKDKMFKMMFLVIVSFIIYFSSAILHNINIELYFAVKSLNMLNFLYFIYYTFNVCWITGSVFMSNSSFELKILDNLYQNFIYKDIDINTNKWDKDGVVYNLEYLLDRYCSLRENIKWNKLTRVRFDSIYKNIKECKYIACKAVVIYYSFIVAFSALILIYNFDIWILIFIIVVYVIMAVITYAVYPLRIGLTNTVFSRCGYFLRYKIVKKYAVNTIRPLSSWYKFVNSLQCILYIYKIAINKEGTDENKNIEIEIIKYIQCRNQNARCDCDLLLCLILYLKYENNNDIKNWDDIYIEILNGTCKEYLIDTNNITFQIINAVISDINRNSNGDYNNKIQANDLKLNNKMLYNFHDELKNVC